MVDDRIATSECDLGVLVSRWEFEPFQGPENRLNSNLDANIEGGGSVTEIRGQKGDATSHWQTKTGVNIVECTSCVPEISGKGAATTAVDQKP